MCSLLEVHTLGPTSTKYMPWAMRFTCQAVAVTGVLAYDVGGRCAHFQRGTAKTGSFGAKIKYIGKSLRIQPTQDTDALLLVASLPAEAPLEHNFRYPRIRELTVDNDAIALGAPRTF